LKNTQLDILVSGSDEIQVIGGATGLNTVNGWDVVGPFGDPGTYAAPNAGFTQYGQFTYTGETLEGKSSTSILFSSPRSWIDGTTALSNGNGWSLVGGVFADTLLGGANNDTFVGGAGDNSILGGAGNDSILGGVDIDNVLGDAGDDIINVYDGANIVNAGADNDSIVGGINADSILGGTGNDTIVGSDGANSFDGGAGNDSITGGTGIDSVLGAAGNDYINVFDGANVVDAGADNDTIIGGANVDSILGGIGNDTISGLAGVDELRGFGVNNSAEVDTLTGGDNRDTFVLASAAQAANGYNGVAGYALITDYGYNSTAGLNTADVIQLFDGGFGGVGWAITAGGVANTFDIAQGANAATYSLALSAGTIAAGTAVFDLNQNGIGTIGKIESIDTSKMTLLQDASNWSFVA
jgi:Ca2+-binding RTX toxin-like protein